MPGGGVGGGDQIGLGLLVEMHDKTQEGFRSVGEAAEQLAARFEASGTRSGEALAKITRGASAMAVPFAIAGAAVVAAVTTIGAESIKMAAEFEEYTTALVTGAGESELAISDSSGKIVGGIDMVREGLLKMSGEVGVSAKELAKGMFMVESAGYHGAEGLQVMEAAAKGAKIGMADQESVANALTTVLKDYNLTGADAAGVTGQLIATVAAGKQHMQDLASSLGTMLPFAAGLSIPFEQVAAAEATMTAHGVDAARAATALRFGITSIIAPSGPAVTAMKDLGLSSKELKAQLATGDFVGVMDKIGGAFHDMAKGGDLVAISIEKVQAATKAHSAAMTEHGAKSKEAGKTLKELTIAQAEAQTSMEDASRAGGTESRAMADLTKMFGGARGAILALTLMPNLDEFHKNITDIGNASEGASKQQEAWALVEKDFNTKMSQTKESLNAAAITLGSALLPYAKDALDLFKKWIPTTEQVREIMMNKVVPALERVAEFIGNHVIPAVASLIHFIRDLSQFISEHVPLVVALGVVILALTSPVTLVIAALVLLVTHWDLVKAKTMEIIGVIGGFFSWLGSQAESAKNAAVAIGQGIIDGIKATILGGIEAIKQAVLSVVHGAIDAAKGAVGGIANLVRGGSGGSSPGPGGLPPLMGKPGRDSAGMPTEDVTKIVPGYALGGTVPGALGAPRLVLAHGGERISPPGGGEGGSTGINVHINLHGTYLGNDRMMLSELANLLLPELNRRIVMGKSGGLIY